ncbi:unnamed protein product [Candida verbasci]|uniref:Enoyl reductase (ER) domain-containing protein n=1 Tax=Candida verbasci TaxID=1227364 RepID=A0A9W4TVJ4_9ASCO|nr:unnamed protein product [Candida verbasci]
MLPQSQLGFGYQLNHKKIQRFENLPIPTPKSNEVLLKVEACGLCLSDPHLLQAGPMPTPNPLDKFVMGHEIAGSIAQVGENFKNHPLYKIGGRFALTIAIACGNCYNCRTGNDGQCTTSIQAYGLNEDGGYQQYLLIRNLRTLLPIPENVSYEVAAVTTDSVLTPFHAIQKVKNYIQPTTNVLVIGCGGLGLNGVQILKNYGCYIVATDMKEQVRQTALEYGANEFYTDLSESEYEPQHFDIIFDFVGLQKTLDLSNYFVKKGGKIVMVGLGNSKLLIPNFLFAVREIEIIFNFGGNSSEQIECMKWVSKGLIKPNVNLVDFEKVPEMLDALKSGKLVGRTVFRPNKL